MAEAKEAEPNERAAASPRRPRRKHVINLCCAQSVHKVVEEVARNLEGLGFQVTVVFGAEARAALLESRTDSDQPTIHVVCVQGSMQERVLKPLRQALATHGGPNHHLFVAVLDVGVPLAMVGQIRRFAEGLERPVSQASAVAAGASAGTGTGPREASTPRDFDQSPTRSYPAVTQVVERGGTKPPVSEGDDADDRSRRRGLGARGRVAQIGPTSKYQAVTASQPVLPPEAGVRKRRRERSRLSPTARRRDPAPSDRVLGLPEQDTSRQDSGPLPRREPQPPPLLPPPAPAAGELARRRSSTTLPPGAAMPPPPPRAPSSTSLPAVGDELPSSDAESTAPHRRPLADAPPEGAAPSHAVGEPDRLVPRSDPGFRFSPPGVKAAEARRPQSGPATTVPLADVLPADRTMVQGVLAEVTRTASTLRLDEPPFPDKATPRRRTAPAEDEPIEPTMLIAAPTGPAGQALDDEVEILEAEPVEPTVMAPAPAKPVAPAVTGKTVIGPPPKPSPEVLAELERGRRAASAARADGPNRVEAAPPVRAKAASSEPARTLVQQPHDADDETGSESSRTLVQRPHGSARGDSPISSESSGTLVLKPRSAMLDEPELSDSSRTLVQGPRAPSDGSSSEPGTPALRLRARSDARPSSESSGARAPQLGPPGPASERSGLRSPQLGPPGPASERSGLRSPQLGPPGPASERSGLRSPQLGPPAAARPSSEASGARSPRFRAPGEAAASTGPSGTVVQPAPSSDTPEVSETEKTLLRGDGTFESSRELMKKIEASQQAKAKAGAPAALATVEPEGRRDAQEPPFKPGKTLLYSDSTSAPLPQRPAEAPAKDEGGTVVTPVPASAAPPALRAAEAAPAIEQAPPAARRQAPPSSVPTERHALLTAEPEPARRSRKRRVPPKKAPPAAGTDAPPDAAVGRSEASPKTAPDAPRKRPRARRKPAASRYQWLWILLVLLTAGGGWGAYQAGLLDGLLGRGRSGGTTVADASRDPSTLAQPTPSDTAARTSAVAAGSASTGPDDDTGPDESGSGQAAAATTTATPTSDTSTDEPTSTAGAPAASTGEPQPAAAGSTGTPDEPAAGSTGGPDEPPTSGGEPQRPPAGDEPQLSPQEALLATATTERRVFMLKTMFTTRRQGSATSWSGGWARCAKLDVDGVKGWRLPHRREMKLINAVLSLPSGTYWTRTVPDDDRQSAFVLDTGDASLSLAPKQEPTSDVVCVRAREFPEK
jgi:hypothetical protein